MLLKCYIQYASKYRKLSHWPQDWERSEFIAIPKKGTAKECSNYRTIAFISHTRKVMLTILQDRFQEYRNRELSDIQAGFRKGRGTRDQIANIRWIIEKAKEFQKNIYFCFIDYAKAFDCVKVTQLCPTLCYPMDYTIHGTFQARILEWVAFPFSRVSYQPRDQTQVSGIAGGFFTS